MPPRQSRSLNAPLDPYGIYGTRTANRLRSSRKRRQSQTALLLLGIVAIGAGVFALMKWRPVNNHYADSVVKTQAQFSAAPVWAQSPSGGEILLPGEDGRLLQISQIEKGITTRSNTNESQSSVLMEADFPLRAPLVEGDIAFVPCEDGTLSAFALREKKVLWRARFDDALSARPAIFNIGKKQVVAAASDAGLLLAFDAHSGKAIWRARLPAPVGEAITVVSIGGKTRVLVPLLGGVAMRGGVWCFDGSNGKILWKFPKDARVEAIQFSAPAIDVEAKLAFIATDAGAVIALDLTTGIYDPKKSIGWKTFVRPAKDTFSTQAVLLRATPLSIPSSEPASNEKRLHDKLIVGGNDGEARGLSATNGSLLWKFPSDAPIISFSSVKNSDGRNLVLVLNRSPRFVLLDAENGEVYKRFSSGGAAFTGAVVSDSAIFAATENGEIHRFALTK